MIKNKTINICATLYSDSESCTNTAEISLQRIKNKIKIIKNINLKVLLPDSMLKYCHKIFHLKFILRIPTILK